MPPFPPSCLESDPRFVPRICATLLIFRVGTFRLDDGEEGEISPVQHVPNIISKFIERRPSKDLLLDQGILKQQERIPITALCASLQLTAALPPLPHSIALRTHGQHFTFSLSLFLMCAPFLHPAIELDWIRNDPSALPLVLRTTLLLPLTSIGQVSQHFARKSLVSQLSLAVQNRPSVDSLVDRGIFSHAQVLS